MKDYIILTDTTSDLTREILTEYNIEMIPGHFMDKSGKEYDSFTDWSKCECYQSDVEFYKTLKSNPDKFSTSAPSIPHIEEAFIKAIEKGLDVLVFTISSVMSGTFNFFTKAKEEVLAKYPEAKILIVDTLRFGSGIGLMCITASQNRADGLSIEENYEYFEKNKNCFHQMGWLDDLSFVAKKGRITASKAFFGQLIGIKPLGESDQNGLTTVLGKAKGEKAAFDAMIKYIEKEIVSPNEAIILVSHSVREKQALQYVSLIKEKFNPKKIYVTSSGPSCGINMGPGLCAAYFIGRPSSKDLVEEKQLVEDILTK